MPGLVNTYPRGLLGLLNAKTGGKTPSVISDTVQSVLDIFPFYLAERRETISSNTAAVAAAGAIFPLAGFAVPQGEMWYVAGFSIVANVALAAGETLGFVPIHRSQNIAGNTADVHLNTPLIAGSTLTVQPASAATQHFWAIPGDQLGAYMYHRVVYAGSLRADAMIVRIQI